MVTQQMEWLLLNFFKNIFFMSVQFNVIERGEPGVPGGGQKRFYASLRSSGITDLRLLSEHISKRSTVSVIDTMAVLEGLIQVIPEQLQIGRIVHLGDLGSMRLSISSEGANKEENVTSEKIRARKILFRPGMVLQDSLRNLRFKKGDN